ncbi:MAG: hypothetical protein ACLSA6_07795 [Holdemania massiliensis]
MLIDDNYGVMVDRIGCECGADLSCFSTFAAGGKARLRGRKAKYIERIRRCTIPAAVNQDGKRWRFCAVTLAPVMLALADQAAKKR